MPPDMSRDGSDKLTLEIKYYIYIPWKTVNPSFQFHCYFVFELFSFTDTYGSFLLELYFIFVLIKKNMYIRNPE